LSKQRATCADGCCGDEGMAEKGAALHVVKLA
jgi:hypothetical protein